MPEYDVPVWFRVEAKNQEAAFEQVAAWYHYDGDISIGEPVEVPFEEMERLEGVREPKEVS